MKSQKKITMDSKQIEIKEIAKLACNEEIDDMHIILDQLAGELDTHVSDMEKESRSIWMVYLLSKLQIQIYQLEHIIKNPMNNEAAYLRFYDLLYSIADRYPEHKTIASLIDKFEGAGAPEHLVLSLRGYLFYKSEEYLKAVEEYHKLLKIETEKKDVLATYQQIALCYYFQYQDEKKRSEEDDDSKSIDKAHMQTLLQQADNAFRRVVVEKPSAFMFHMLLKVSSYRENMDDAVSFSRQIIAVANPLDADDCEYVSDARRVLANYYLESNNLKDALEQYKYLVNSTTSDHDILQEYGELLNQAKNKNSVDKVWAETVIESIVKKTET